MFHFEKQLEKFWSCAWCLRSASAVDRAIGDPVDYCNLAVKVVLRAHKPSELMPSCQIRMGRFHASSTKKGRTQWSGLFLTYPNANLLRSALNRRRFHVLVHMLGKTLEILDEALHQPLGRRVVGGLVGPGLAGV